VGPICAWRHRNITSAKYNGDVDDFQQDDAVEHGPCGYTIAVRAAQTQGHVGMTEGLLRVTDRCVDVLKLWLRHYPGDKQTDLQNLNDVGLRKRADFRQVNPQEYAIEIEIDYNMYRMRRFTPNTVRAGCCLWALPTMPYRELTSQG
jgi:hypothetical protein